MATFVRNRVLHQLTWVPEEETDRAERREALCELDGLLAQLEQVNLKGGVIPPRVLVALRRHGVSIQARIGSPDGTACCSSAIWPCTGPSSTWRL